MNMVRHDDKLMQQVSSLVTIIEQHVDQQPCASLDAKDRDALPCNCRDEKRTLRVHAPDRRSARMKSSVISVTHQKKLLPNREERTQKTTTGAKARKSLCNLTRP